MVPLSLESLPLQTGHRPARPGGLKYKRRRVSAVRDFPPGTGCTCMAPVSDQVDGSEMMELESAELQIAERVLNESDDASKNSNEIHMLESNFPAKKEANNLAHQQPSCSPLTCSVSGLGRSVKRSYPPHGKVSAVRDFPPFTGPNAPTLSHEQIKELLSAETKNLDAEKSVIEGMAAMGHEKRRRPDTQDGSTEHVKLMNFEKRNAQKKSEKYGCGDDTYGGSSRTEVWGENMIKKKLVYQGSRNLGKEVSDLPGSINESQSEKVVVKPLKVVSRKAETQITIREGKEVVLGCPAKRKNCDRGEFSDQTCGFPGSTNQSQSGKVVVKPLKVASRKAEKQISRGEGKEIVLGCPAKRKNCDGGEVSDQTCALPGSADQSQTAKVVVKPLKVVSRKAETQISRREGKEIVLGCPAKRSEFSGQTRRQRKSFFL